MRQRSERYFRILKAVAVLSLIAIVASPPASFAESRAGKFRLAVGAGLFEYTYFDSDESYAESHSDLTELSVGPSGQLRVGYFMTDVFEAGVDVSLSYRRYTDPRVDLIVWRVGPYAEANIPINADGTIMIAPGCGVSYGHEPLVFREFDKFSASVSGTIKWFIAENVSLDGSLQASYFHAEDSQLDLDGFTIGPHIGISIWL